MIDDSVDRGLSDYVGVMQMADSTDVIDWHHRRMREERDG